MPPPPPHLLGYSNSIHQWVILDVQPLLKPSFWQKKMIANEFVDLDASNPLYPGAIFMGGGWGVKIFLHIVDAVRQFRPRS